MSLFGQSTGQSGSLLYVETHTSAPKIVFGNTQSNNQSSGGLFGSPTASSQQPQTGGLFGSANQQNQNTGGGNNLFGGASGNTNAATQAGNNLFGNPSSTATGGNLFGSTPASTQQQSGGLFGSALPSTTQQTGGLFGSTTNTQTQPSTGLFGNSTAQNQPSTNLFGSSTTNTQPSTNPFGSVRANTQPTTNLFTSTSTAQNQQQQQQPPPRPSLSLFANAPPANTRLPTLSLGQGSVHPANAATTPSGTKIDIAHLRGTTRFSDLTDDLQREILQIEDMISAEIGYKDQIDAMMPAHAASVASLGPDVSAVTERLGAVEGGIDNDGVAVREVREVVRNDAEDARRVFRNVENLKLPPSFHYGAWSSAQPAGSLQRVTEPGDDDNGGSVDLLAFFRRQCEEMGKTLKGYEDALAEVETHVRNVE
ncbi:MAG: hypothetical protein Q9162_007913, partial [Coniocarpon cinnabarinum]